MKEKLIYIKRIKNKFIGLLKRTMNNFIYKIMKRWYDFLYMRKTYIPEKALWVATVVFPKVLVEDEGIKICGITDVFRGNKTNIYFIPIYTHYITMAEKSSSRRIHESIVKGIKDGTIPIDKPIIRIHDFPLKDRIAI